MTNSGERILHLVEHLPLAEAITGNKDLLREIFLRLPIKSLLKFESVSKKWLSLIFDPHFAQSYTRRRNPNYEPSGLLLNHEYAGLQFVPFNDDGDQVVNADSRTYQIDIYLSETRSLRPPASGSGDPLPFTALPPGIRFRRPTYCNGAIHWLSEGKTSLYFDTHTECLKTMPMPPFYEGFDFDINVGYFGEPRVHLHLIVTDQPSAIEFDMLELKTDYSGWFVRYHVNLDALPMTFWGLAWGVFNAIFKEFSVLCVNQAAKEDESILVLFVSCQAFSFNLNNQRSKKICDLVPCHKIADHALDYEWSDAYQYIETVFHV